MVVNFRDKGVCTRIHFPPLLKKYVRYCIDVKLTNVVSLVVLI